MRLRDKDGSLQADGRRSRNSFRSEKGKSPENKGKNLLPTGRQKKAVYFRGALVSLASVGGRHCPRQGFLFSARVHEVNRFFLSATKKKRNTEKREKGKAKRKLEKKEKKGNLVEEKNPECAENYSQNTSLTNSVCFNHHDPLRFLSSARSSLVI